MSFVSATRGSSTHGENGASDSKGEEPAATIVNARESLRRLREPTQLISPDQTQAIRFPESGSRSERNLRILQNFSQVLRNLPDRAKLLESAIEAVFDNLDVRRGFIGFFGPGGQLEIHAQRNLSGSRHGVSYSRSIVDRVRKEGVAILFSDQSEELSGSRSMMDSRSVVLLQIKSAMCLPLFHSEDVTGVLYLDNRERSQGFTQDDLYFANILSHLISLALEKEELYQGISDENLELKSILQHKNKLIGVSSPMKDVLRKIKKVAAFETTVLIHGESGTGKELVARAIHDRSARRGKPFVAVNCAAIPETLLESELFGYAPHSGISGADPKGRAGKFEQADGGTLFLDEIGDMSLATQAKILRVLEERVVDRLGGMEPRAGRLAHPRGDQQSVAEGGRGRNVSRGSLLPSEGLSDRLARLAEAA